MTRIKYQMFKGAMQAYYYQKLYFINPPGGTHPLHLTHSDYLWAVGNHTASALKAAVEIFLLDVCFFGGRKPPQTCKLYTLLPCKP